MGVDFSEQVGAFVAIRTASLPPIPGGHPDREGLDALLFFGRAPEAAAFRSGDDVTHMA